MKYNPVDKIRFVAEKQLPKIQARVDKIKQQMEALKQELIQLSEQQAAIETLIRSKRSTGIEISHVSIVDKVKQNGPVSEAGINIGLSLKDKEEFNHTELQALLPSGAVSYQWIARWKEKSWIETLGAGRYKIKQCFGQ